MLLFSPEILTIAADRGLPEQWAPLCVAVGSAAGAAGRLLCPAASAVSYTHLGKVFRFCAANWPNSRRVCYNKS